MDFLWYNYGVNKLNSVCMVMRPGYTIERGKTFMKRIISIITAMILVSTMLMVFTSCGSSEDEVVEVITTEPVSYTESMTPIESYTSEEVLMYFNTVVNSLKETQPKLGYYFEINVPDDSIVIANGDEDSAEIAALNAAAPGIKDIMLQDIRENGGELAEGTDNSDILYVQGESFVSNLTAADIDSATIKEVGEFYYITIIFNDYEAGEDASALTKAFDLRDKDEILASDEFAKTSEYLVLNDYTVGYSGCQITAKVNRYTDEVVNLSYYKAANVVADMTGAGTYEALGDVSVSFTLEDKANFDFIWESELPVSPLETTTEATPTAPVAE